MSTFKCKMCDAVLNVREGTSIYVCEYCGTKQTVPIVDDDVETAYKLAVKLMCNARTENDYLQAAEHFCSVSGYKDADELCIKCEELAREKKIAAETEKANNYSKTEGSSIFYIFAAIPIITSFICLAVALTDINCGFFEGAVIIVIMLIANIISIYYCSYMYYFMESNQDFSGKFWTSVVFDTFSASVVIFIIMSNLTDKLYGEKFFVGIFVISAIISFISGYRGYKSGENEVRNKK